MKYSEFNNSNEYKIRIARKKYSFRDAAKYYLKEKYKPKKDEIFPEDHLYHKSNKIIDQILTVIKDNDFELDNNNKIIFTNHIIIKLAQKEYLAKNSFHVFEIIEYFKKRKVISKKSQSFPKPYKEKDVNQLTSCFSSVDFSVYEKILDMRDEILNVILNTENEEERELYLFYYLNLFSRIKYKDDIYTNFTRHKLFDLGKMVVLIFEKKHSKEYSTVEIEYFDEKLNDVLKAVFFNLSNNLLDMTDHYFQRDLQFYKNKLGIYLKERYVETTGFIPNNYKKLAFKKLIRNQIEVEYQFKHTPFEYMLHIITLYPHTNYLELMKLFPDIIHDKHYEAIELKNIKLQKKHNILDEEDLVEMDIKDYLNVNTDAYVEFRKFRKFNKVNNKRDYLAYFNRLEKFIIKHQESFAFPQMFYYVKHYIWRSRFSDSRDEKLASSTIYGEINILFNSCYQFIIKEGKIDETVVELIENNINSYENTETVNKYRRIINPFLEMYGFNIGKNNRKFVKYARKSLIFKMELDQIFKVLVEQDTSKYGLDLATAENRFIIYQRFVFCMLMYYSGLRESELWSRMVSDIYIFEDKITIDVNTNFLINRFKTHSAKRRVEFTIDDNKYLDIFKEYLALVESKKIKYFFPRISDKNKILKNDVQNINYFLTCNEVIQSITGRYTSLHSFRHTYVTNNMRKLVMKNKKQKKDVYNLVNMTGHLGPDVTLRFYTHIDYVLNYQNKQLF